MSRRNTKAKSKAKAAVKETPRYFIAAAGDNSAESSLGAVKRTMRRVDNAGRMQRGTSSAKHSVDSLASAALTIQAGFVPILQALKIYRESCTNGLVQVPPKDAYDPDSLPWLYT